MLAQIYATVDGTIILREGETERDRETERERELDP